MIPRKIVNYIFSIVKKHKPHISDCYDYSHLNMPIKGNRKYTEKQFIEGILSVLVSGCFWTRYTGFVPGKQLNKRHNEYIKLGIYDQLYKSSVKKYLKKCMKNTFRLSADSTFIFNKLCKDVTGRNPYYKNKRSIKISTIVDDNKVPLSISIGQANIHDSDLIHGNLDQILTDKLIPRKINKIFLADKGYDSSIVRAKLRAHGYVKVIIPRNKRNTKDPKKLHKLKMNSADKKLYKKRICVENFFGTLKRLPKIDCIYERSLKSYLGLVQLFCSYLILQKNS